MRDYHKPKRHKMSKILLVKMDYDTYNDIIKLLNKREEQRKRCRDRYASQSGITYNKQPKNILFEVYDVYDPDKQPIQQIPLQNLLQQQQQQLEAQRLAVLQIQQQQQYLMNQQPMCSQ